MPFGARVVELQLVDLLLELRGDHIEVGSLLAHRALVSLVDCHFIMVLDAYQAQECLACRALLGPNRNAEANNALHILQRDLPRDQLRRVDLDLGAVNLLSHQVANQLLLGI